MPDYPPILTLNPFSNKWFLGHGRYKGWALDVVAEKHPEYVWWLEIGGPRASLSPKAAAALEACIERYAVVERAMGFFYENDPEPFEEFDFPS